MTTSDSATLNYESASQQHRPSDPHELAAEIRRLHSTGLSPRDIAAALRLALPAVVEALR